MFWANLTPFSLQFSLREAAGAVGLSIGTKLGRGAYGTVWSATPRRDAISSLRSVQSVVIKHVSDPFETYLDGVRTLREVEFLRVLDHPNIVKLLAVLPSPSPAHVDNVCLVSCSS